MKKCPNPSCTLPIVETASVCPACGTALEVTATSVPGYELLELLRERPGCAIWKARRQVDHEVVCLRIYTLQTSGESPMGRARAILAKMEEVPEEYAIRTLEFQSLDASRVLRISQWQTAQSWGNLLGAERFFRDPKRRRQWVDLMLGMARCVEEVHKAGHLMPFLSMDDLLPIKGGDDALQVKVDVKLSRFLPLESTSPEEAHIRRLHPDLNTPGRILDQRSDLWSLGRLYLDLLTGSDEHPDYQRLSDQIYLEFKPIVLHRKLSALLRQMVDDDPSKRPSSAADVVAALESITDEDVNKWTRFGKDPGKLKKVRRQVVGVAMAAVLVAGMISGLLYWRQQQVTYKEVASMKQEFPEERAKALVAKYGRSVAYVLTEAWIEVKGKKLPVMSSSGTAFLVSSEGHLLSNRHVVTPWMGDEDVDKVISLLRANGTPFRFFVTYRLWFDGDEAFRPPFVAADSNAPEDIYRFETAYCSDNTQRTVKVAGVMPPPQDFVRAVNSSMNDDLAVLEIDILPEGAVPIPLLEGTEATRGSRIVAMGYSQGRSSIADTRALVRTSDGTITRVFRDAIAIDADIQHGNSGGPVLNLDGKAVGIASQIFVDGDNALEMTSMGRVLPIGTARAFLDSVRKGDSVWNGLPAAAFEAELSSARQALKEGRWREARELATLEGLQNNPEAALVAISLSATDQGLSREGRALLEKLPRFFLENPFPSLLRYWDDWVHRVPETRRAERDRFLQAAWDSPFEPFEQVVRLLEGSLALEEGLAVAESDTELALLCWAAATMAERAGDPQAAIAELQQGLMLVEDDEIMRNLMQSQLYRLGGTEGVPVTGDIPSTGNKMAILQKAFESACQGDWNQVAVASKQYLELPHRESANTLGVGLIYCQALGLAGDPDAETKALETYLTQTKNDWYRQISECLLGKIEAETLLKQASGNSSQVITLGVALGLHYEGRKEPDQATRWYDIALDTCQANWFEFQLAMTRRNALRQSPKLGN